MENIFVTSYFTDMADKDRALHRNVYGYQNNVLQE